MSTIFKKIIDKEIKADIVYEDNEILAFKDINPKAPIHLLFLPKKEIKNINDMTVQDTELIGKIFLAIKKTATDLGVADEGYRVITNCNEYGGQEVYHLHFHMLAGKKLTGLIADD